MSLSEKAAFAQIDCALDVDAILEIRRVHADRGYYKSVVAHAERRLVDDFDTYITGTGQILGGIHAREACLGRHCVIHDPSDHGMRDLPTHWRPDREIMERICPHGVGHPDPDDAEYLRSLAEPGDEWAVTVHGCDGCCWTPPSGSQRRFVFVTERRFDPRDSRVERCEVPLRDEDAARVSWLIAVGRLGTKAGVRAWVSPIGATEVHR